MPSIKCSGIISLLCNLSASILLQANISFIAGENNSSIIIPFNVQ